MTFYAIVCLLGGGLAAGFLTGLLGLGGGVVMVPLLYQYYVTQGVTSQAAFTTAVASSLMVMFGSGSYATWLHWRAGRICWLLVFWIGLGVLVGALFGSHYLPSLPNEIVRKAFGLFLLSTIGLLLLPNRATVKRDQSPSIAITETDLPDRIVFYPWSLCMLGFCLGGLGSIFGVGGAVIAIPALVSFFRVPLLMATATASATIVVTASMAFFSYGWIAAQNPKIGMPPYGYGWVDAVAVLNLLCGTLISTRWGIWLAQRLAARWLKIALAGFNSAMAIRFLFF